jgi:hypothetical protein
MPVHYGVESQANSLREESVMLTGNFFSCMWWEYLGRLGAWSHYFGSEATIPRSGVGSDGGGFPLHEVGLPCTP